MLRVIAFFFCWLGGWVIITLAFKASQQIAFSPLGHGVNWAVLISFVVAAAVTNQMGK